LNEGEFNQRLRPLIVLMNRPAYRIVGNDIRAAIRAFDLMNVCYLGWLTVAVLMLASAYGASIGAQVFVALNLGLCISTARYFAYYPTLIDLGAYAVMTTAVYFVVTGRRVWAAIFTVLAVLSREFGPAIALLGIHRDLRTGRGLWRTLATFSPALVVAAVWRYIVAFHSPEEGALPLNDLAVLVGNLHFWSDVQFVAFFFYFAVTVFGGISMLLVARASQCLRFGMQEPEWFTYSIGFLVVAALGGPDIWRYLAFLLPVAVVCVAACEREWGPRRRIRLFLLATTGTLITQRPFEPISGDTYFNRWFPYVVAPGAAADDLERLWLFWGGIMLATVVGVWLLAAFDDALTGVTPAMSGSQQKQ
jgi:hypothetical protein